MPRHAERYYTGKPCARGHLDWRLTSGRCTSCHIEDNTKWKKANPKKVAIHSHKQNNKNHFSYQAVTNKHAVRIIDLTNRMNEGQKKRFADWLLWKPHSRLIERTKASYSVDNFLADYGRT